MVIFWYEVYDRHSCGWFRWTKEASFFFPPLVHAFNGFLSAIPNRSQTLTTSSKTTIGESNHHRLTALEKEG
jgi:hypothetical protein